MRSNDGWTRLNVDQWCCLRFRSATDKRSTSPTRLHAWPEQGRRVGLLITNPSICRFIGSAAVPTRAGPLSAGRSWTGTNGMQLQPCVQPLERVAVRCQGFEPGPSEPKAYGPGG